MTLTFLVSCVQLLSTRIKVRHHYVQILRNWRSSVELCTCQILPNKQHPTCSCWFLNYFFGMLGVLSCTQSFAYASYSATELYPQIILFYFSVSAKWNLKTKTKVFSFAFQDTVSLSSHGCPGTPSVDQTDLKLIEIHLSLPPCARSSHIFLIKEFR